MLLAQGEGGVGSGALFAWPMLLVPKAKLGGGGQQRLLRSRSSACASWHWQGVEDSLVDGELMAMLVHWWRRISVGALLGWWQLRNSGVFLGNVVGLLALASWWGGGAVTALS